jgi:hypothetical protein
MRRALLLLAAFAGALGATAAVLVAGHSPSAGDCTLVLSPGASVGTAVNGSKPGDVICLRPGTYTSPTWREHGGTADGSVTLTSLDPTNPALLTGRFVTSGSASWLVIRDLRFVWSTQGNSSALPGAVVLGTPHESFVHNDVSGASTTICLNGVEYGGSKVEYSLIDHNLIHDCGNEAHSDSRLHSQGIYMAAGPGDTISNNWVWRVAARCYQVRGEKGTTTSPSRWLNNVCAESREGFVFGDLTPTYNVVQGNIVASVVGNSAYTYGSVGVGNTFKGNCISKPFGNNAGVTLANNTVTTVAFVDAAHHNYELTAATKSGPCGRAPAVGSFVGEATSAKRTRGRSTP